MLTEIVSKYLGGVSMNKYNLHVIQMNLIILCTNLCKVTEIPAKEVVNLYSNARIKNNEAWNKFTSQITKGALVLFSAWTSRRYKSLWSLSVANSSDCLLHSTVIYIVTDNGYFRQVFHNLVGDFSCPSTSSDETFYSATKSLFVFLVREVAVKASSEIEFARDEKFSQNKRGDDSLFIFLCGPPSKTFTRFFLYYLAG